MKSAYPILSTIGYESADLADFISTLQAAGIRQLIDVRELAISRRKGFAKGALSKALAHAGIEYIHLRGLGDPKEGRQAARSGNFSHFKKIFNKHMRSEVAQTDLKIAASIITKGSTCLMCFERNHTECHRAIVAQRLHDSIPLTVHHLGVTAGFSKIKKAETYGQFSEQRA